MTRWLQSLLIVALTAAVTFFLATREPANAAPPPPVVAATTSQLVEAPPPFPAIQRHDPQPRVYTLHRNLFAYAAAPAPVRVERPVFVPAPEPRRVEVVAARIEPQAPPPPRFPYRFIGRFGPDGNPVAAFARDGEIVTARRGDRIGAFTLRAIGLESVEVAGEAGITRIAFGGN